jgi:hypothetical protein
MLRNISLFSRVKETFGTLKRPMGFLTSLVLLAVTLGLSSGVSRSTGSPAQHKVEGEVLERSNAPIPVVLVRVYRGDTNIKLNESSSDKDGKYSITFSDPGEAIRIRYDLTGWEPDVVSNISGARDHKITKVLNRVGTAHSYSEKRQLVSLLGLLYRLDVANGESRHFVERYGTVVDGAKLPEELSRQLAYDIRFPDEPQAASESPARMRDVVCSRVGDASITEEVMDRLSKSPLLKTSAIEVDTKGGIVTLSGKVNSPALKLAASREVSDVQCVKSVINQLTIALK